MVATPQIGRKLAHKRTQKTTSASPDNMLGSGSLAALMQTFREEAARMTPEQIAAEDAKCDGLVENLSQQRLRLPVPDVFGHD